MPQALPTTRLLDSRHPRSAALGLLLEGLVDYAGLFPPAKLSMPAAVQNYASYANGDFRWMLGRFILPVARLAEFEATLAEIGALDAKWSLSALLGPDIVADTARVVDFNRRRHQANGTISSVELKSGAPAEILHAHTLIPRKLPAFFEIPLSADVTACVAALSHCGRSAKLRTGGETPDMIPASPEVANFLHLCAEADVPFKATAGLHHPIRSQHNLTYAADSPSGTMHGFLNVFMAAALLRNRAIVLAEAIDLLNETSAAAFNIDDAHVGWRSHELGCEQLTAARRNFSLSFGSCSFSEPVEDLQSLSLL